MTKKLSISRLLLKSAIYKPKSQNRTDFESKISNFNENLD